MKFVKTGAIAAAAALACVGLTACQSRVGAAAVVGSHRITETTVQNYMTPTASPIAVQQGVSVAPRAFVLQSLISNQLFEAAIAKTPGGAATPAELEAAKEAAFQAQGTTDADLVTAVTQVGLSANFAPVYAQSIALTSLLEDRVGTTSADVLGAVAKADLPVSVSTRYGSWNASTLSVDAAKTPSFLTGLPTPAAPSAAPSAG